MWLGSSTPLTSSDSRLSQFNPLPTVSKAVHTYSTLGTRVAFHNSPYSTKSNAVMADFYSVTGGSAVAQSQTVLWTVTGSDLKSYQSPLLTAVKLETKSEK